MTVSDNRLEIARLGATFAIVAAIGVFIGAAMWTGRMPWNDGLTALGVLVSAVGIPSPFQRFLIAPPPAPVIQVAPAPPPLTATAIVPGSKP